MKLILAALVALVAMLALAAPPGAQPMLVGEGVISTPDDEAGFALSPDGNTAVFGKTSPATTGDPMRLLCVSRRDAGGHWSAPEIAPFSGKYHDLNPAFDPHGSRLYFASDRPNRDSAEQDLNLEKHDLNIWFVEWTDNRWSEPRALPSPVNSPAQEYGATVAANGTLYFASSRQGGKGSFDIYRSPLEDGEYRNVENLGEAVNTPDAEIDAAVSPDESMLVFTALGRVDEVIGVHKNYARGDLYVSFRKNGVWTAARNCGSPINSGGGESRGGFSADGSRFFFSSDRGFATYRMPHRMTWAELKRGLTSTLNGMGNIYEINANALRALDRP